MKDRPRRASTNIALCRSDTRVSMATRTPPAEVPAPMAGAPACPPPRASTVAHDPCRRACLAALRSSAVAQR